MKTDRAASGLLSLYAMIFVSVVADVAVVPLLPTLTREHGLSSLDTALLLSTTTFAMVVITLPLGRLADRVGARPLVACAGGFVVLGSIVLALASGLPALLAGRTLIGIANGIIWTAGVMIAGAPGGPAGATGRAIAAGGTGLLVGPVLAGLLADRIGTWAPFAAGAALALPVTVFFALQRSAPVERPAPAAEPAARGAHRNRIVVYAMLATVLLGFVGGMGNLLGTLRLSENGLSPSGIGVLFSIGALVWIVVAPLAGPHGRAAQPHRADRDRLRTARRRLARARWRTARHSRSPRSCWHRAPAARASTRSATCSPARARSRPAPAAAR